MDAITFDAVVCGLPMAVTIEPLSEGNTMLSAELPGGRMGVELRIAGRQVLRASALRMIEDEVRYYFGSLERATAVHPAR